MLAAVAVAAVAAVAETAVVAVVAAAVWRRWRRVVAHRVILAALIASQTALEPNTVQGLTALTPRDEVRAIHTIQKLFRALPTRGQHFGLGGPGHDGCHAEHGVVRRVARRRAGGEQKPADAQ